MIDHPSPFLAQKPEEFSPTSYERVINDLARQFIYNTGELKPSEIERTIDLAISRPGVSTLEEERGDLLALKELLQGISEHESTNTRLKLWLPTIAREKNPETLTREQVMKKFETFEHRRSLEHAEQQAMEHYREWLASGSEPTLKLSENITLDRTDIEVLVIDLQVGVAERVLDTEERKNKLEALDRELVTIIERMPRGQAGKKYELEEICLLRRLIHNADTGHIASVRHGTPREDLRKDLASIDMVLTSAGRQINFQMKTHNPDARLESREVQYQSIKRAQKNAEGTETNVVILNTKAIENTYQNSLRQSDGRVPHSVRDKYAALQPIVGVIQQRSTQEQTKFLEPLGFKAADLAREEEAFEKGQMEMTKHGEEWKKKREEEQLRNAEIERAYLATKRAEEDREIERNQRILNDQLRQAQASADKRAADVAAAARKQAVQQAALAAATQAKETEKKTLEKATLKQEKRKAEEAGKKWAKTKLDQLSKPDALIVQGLLAKEDRNTASAILSAKKRLEVLYPNVKSVLKDFPFEA